MKQPRTTSLKGHFTVIANLIKLREVCALVIRECYNQCYCRQRLTYSVGVGRELVPRIGSNGYILIVHQAAAAPTPI